MKKFILSMFVMVSFGFYAFWQDKTTAATGAGNFSVPMMTKGGMMNQGMYKDGQYVGVSADAYYGYVQVKAVIAGGRLTDVVFLDYPQDRSTSLRINRRALPILRQEALAAQSAKVDGVSGASATSPAFVESLTSALNEAKV